MGLRIWCPPEIDTAADPNDPYHDEFHFAYVALAPGRHTIVARVDSLVNTDALAKAGVMIRDTLDRSSRYALMAVAPSNGVTSRLRRDEGGPGAAMGETRGGPQRLLHRISLRRRHLMGDGGRV